MPRSLFKFARKIRGNFLGGGLADASSVCPRDGLEEERVRVVGASSSDASVSAVGDFPVLDKVGQELEWRGAVEIGPSIYGFIFR
jgi:hypothetical protein